MHAERMRQILYRKVVLSDSSPRPAAMLITGHRFGVAAFAMGDGVWRLATPMGGDRVEDALYYKGRFYSITYSGQVETWEHGGGDACAVTKAVVAPRLLADADRKASCVYYTQDDDRRPRNHGHQDNNDSRVVGVYSLKDGTVGKVDSLQQHGSWPPPAWFMPSFP
ncbi:unnamed protein product [Alopecurus aequalis]